jgi:hypothetical protein
VDAHPHEHAPGTPEHSHDDNIIEVFPGETIKVRFYQEDGSYVTVHVHEASGELRACGSHPFYVERRKPDVAALILLSQSARDVWKE